MLMNQAAVYANEPGSQIQQHLNKPQEKCSSAKKKKNHRQFESKTIMLPFFGLNILFQNKYEHKCNLPSQPPSSTSNLYSLCPPLPHSRMQAKARNPPLDKKKVPSENKPEKRLVHKSAM